MSRQSPLSGAKQKSRLGQGPSQFDPFRTSRDVRHESGIGGFTRRDADIELFRSKRARSRTREGSPRGSLLRTKRC
jgi:hypothetical protein